MHKIFLSVILLDFICVMHTLPFKSLGLRAGDEYYTRHGYIYSLNENTIKQQYCGKLQFKIKIIFTWLFPLNIFVETSKFFSILWST